MKYVIITGASRGLGLVVANTFAANGWSVIGTGTSPRPEQLVSETMYYQFDNSDYDAANNFWQTLKNEAGNDPVCLINNAGGYKGGKLQELKPEDYVSQMQSIYFSAVHMTRGLINNFAQAKIVNIISSTGVTPLANNSAYGPAKTAEAHFFNSLQKEYPPEQYQKWLRMNAMTNIIHNSKISKWCFLTQV